jgi:hypothetical protein
MIKNYIGLHVKYLLLLLSDFNETWIFLDIFLKNTQIWNSMEICLVGAELYHADRQIDRHDEAFRSFAKAPINSSSFS